MLAKRNREHGSLLQQRGLIKEKHYEENCIGRDDCMRRCYG